MTNLLVCLKTCIGIVDKKYTQNEGIIYVFE